MLQSNGSAAGEELVNTGMRWEPRHCRHQIAQGHHRGALLRLVADALPSTALSVDGGVHLLLHVLQRPLRLQARVALLARRGDSRRGERRRLLAALAAADAS